MHGSAHPQLTEAALKTIRNGTCWGVPNASEWDHASLLLERLPWLDQVRYTNSGTEAVMTAVRVARATTGRERCIMMKASYHGSSDVAMCTGNETERQGVPPGVIKDITIVELNDVKALTLAIETAPTSYAAIVIDLLPNRAGLIEADHDFVLAARSLATKHGIVLISTNLLACV
ncbi:MULTISPECIES: aminotransferase class III-fold pyridoxal phosphate-dependent enzyme [Klebsiella/Raoultella group]|uniref:aminotransferase class III-fold pyridoxal phosphate-dependent enzyme n=1 Tax=Raoultella ornithinolytica TaxID=54291 RepID=UPI002269CB0A|nr:aminotransferase class III-fold pyridoxal phosphate-dependent enzyme [Raoultella ornithinolytica]